MSALDVQVGGEHYKTAKIQPVQYIEANQLAFLEGCVVKRVTRHNKPTGKGRQDIEKAIHELQLLLELRYGEEVEAASVESAKRTFVPDGLPAVKASLPMPAIQPPKVQGQKPGDCLVCGEFGGHFGLPCPKAVPKAYLGDLPPAYDGHD